MKYFIGLLRRWGIKIGTSITDQGVLSGANFLLNVFLIRWFAPDEYGIFAITLSIFLFSSTFHHAFVFDPVSIIGAAYCKDNFKKYASIAVWFHWALTITISAISGSVFIYLLARGNVFAYPVLGLAIATPLVLFLYLFRQLCYLQEKPHLALCGSLLYALFLFGGILIIYKLNWLSAVSVFSIMGLASIGAAIVFWPYLGVRIPDFYWSNVKDLIKDVSLEHWNYGKWMMGSAFTNWLSICIYVPLVGLFVGVAQAGVFKAMQNLMLPLQKIQAALTSLFLPWFSKQRLAGGADYLRKAVYKMLLLSLSFSLCYVTLVIYYKDFIVGVLYGKDYYTAFIGLIPYLGLAVFIESLANTFYIGLRALKRPSANFWAQGLGAVLTLTLGLYLVSTLKLYGAALSYILTALIISLMLARFFFGYVKKSSNICVE
jgi:O-antigen/teichoic acid export membrane protein